MSQYVTKFDRFIPWGEDDARLGAEKIEREGLPERHPGNRWPCKLCIHPKRLELNTKILSHSISLVKIAEMVGPGYHYKQVERHRDMHLLPRLGQMFAPKTTALDLMNPLPFGASIERKLEWYRINFLILRQRHLKRTEDGEVTNDAGDTAMIMKLLVEARNTDVIATKFRDGDGAKVVNGMDTEKWERIKTRLSAALESHPEARAAVLDALEEGE